MSSLLNKQKPNKNTSNTLKGAQIIRDSRFMSLSKQNKSSFERTPLCSENSWNKEIEQQIALHFEKKDIIEVANLLCKKDESPLYVKKTKNSPLYVYVTANQNNQTTQLQDKISIAQTALYLLIKDTEVPIKEVAQAFKIVSDRNSAYHAPLIITEEFHKRLGLFENIKKTEAIIQKLIFTGQNLGLRQ